MKKILSIALCLASSNYGTGLASVLQEKKQHVTHAVDENKFTLSLNIDLQDVTSLVLRKSKVLQNMLNSCVPSEEMVSIPFFTYRTFKNLESVLRDTKIPKQLSCKELIDVLKLYDYLHIQDNVDTTRGLIDAIAHYNQLEAIIYDDSLLDDLKQQILRKILSKYYFGYSLCMLLGHRDRSDLFYARYGKINPQLYADVEELARKAMMS